MYVHRPYFREALPEAPVLKEKRPAAQSGHAQAAPDSIANTEVLNFGRGRKPNVGTMSFHAFGLTFNP
jgi:hypothetical protein